VSKKPGAVPQDFHSKRDTTPKADRCKLVLDGFLAAQLMSHFRDSK
jgi:hypothetical protein